MLGSLVSNAVGLAALLGLSVALADGGFVAGLQPDRRPAGAPVKTEATVSPEQLAQYLRGIEGPPPGNVATIAATGQWFVPLRHPGSTPPYDLRGWHTAPAHPAANASSPR
mgnify:FL=1|jgi:hypothetical protein